MFGKLSQAAEQLATNVSRRQFLGRLGGGALALATALGGLLALPAVAHGKRPPPAVCSATSEWACIGMPVGSICEDGRQGGICKQRRGSEDCYCYVKKERF